MKNRIEKDQVKDSKHFCMLPWNHLHIWPDNSVYPCCIADSSKPVGRYLGNLEDQYNSENMKNLRNRMLADQPSAECSRCYELEKNKIHSLRMTANTKYLRYFDEVVATKTDGSVDGFTMRYLDIRFSNLCNLRCRSCGPDLSSSWADDQKKMYPGWDGKKLIQIEPNESFWNDIKPSLDHVHEAYFAGGEPLITDETYRVLDYWIEKKNFDVQLGFTTNFSHLSHKGKDILNYWKLFPKTIVSASLDDSGTRAEYLRKGTNWNRIVENRKKMLVEAPEVDFEITPTISVFNISHFPEFHFEWLELGYVHTNALRLNILTQPSNMSFLIIPKEKRKPLIDKWNYYLDRIILEMKDQHGYNIFRTKYNKTILGYQSVIQALSSDDYINERELFFERNVRVDKVRDEKFFSVYPELQEFLG